MTEFLPLCDVLFNVISLAGYFCDVVFDVVLGYALLERGRTGYFVVIMCFVLSSLIISQIVSLKWYCNEFNCLNTILNQTNNPNIKEATSTVSTQLESKRITTTSSNNQEDRTIKMQKYMIVALHFIQFGVLWRYAKLFVPVDLRRVKHEVRDLCMLRLVHAFCEAAPMLLFQLYLILAVQSDSKFFINASEIKLRSLNGHSIIETILQMPTVAQQQTEKTFKDLNVVSATLSLFNVCWALASFSKNVRLQNVHRLVLTWLGVIFQFLWRLGTVTSRMVSLTVYATLYSYWVFLVIVLHWFSMVLWLISPKNVFHKERISRLRKTLLSSLIAFVFIFAYINLQEVNHRQKMITFYVVMFLENSLLVCLWLVGVWPNKPTLWSAVPVLVFGSFIIGMIFMILYYRYFHIRRLGYDVSARYSGHNVENDRDITETKSNINRSNAQSPIVGVFNCRFSNPIGNGATKRKKKKPTTFVPSPTLGFTSKIAKNNVGDSGLMEIPFWRQPVPRSQTGGSSENEGSVGSKINIHQKLQEKKQKQLAELKIIEEEIKQGKLGGPLALNINSQGDDGKASLPRQPIPRAKKHINLDPIKWCSNNHDTEKSFNNIDEINNLNKFTTQYDQAYASFGFTNINISTLDPQNIQNITVSVPLVSSQSITASEGTSLNRQMPLRSKIAHTTPRNPFTESYRNLINTPVSNLNSNSNSQTSSQVRNGGVFDHLNCQNVFLEINYPRQISGTYSVHTENSCSIDTKLPFPYNVVPPPRSKLDSRSTPQTPSVVLEQSVNKIAGIVNKTNQRHLQRAETPEILLAPHYLDNSHFYYDWIGRESIYRTQDGERNHVVSSGDENLEASAGEDSILAAIDRNGNRNPSDIDSQVSLPRSYTLPREFRYYKRIKGTKFTRNEQFVTSNNSSDGDVDSGDDNESERHSDTSQCHLKKRQQNSRVIQQKINLHDHLSNTHQLCHRNNFTSSSIEETSCESNKNNNEIIHLDATAVNNFDLIREVDPVNFNSCLYRPSRYRVYGAGKHSFIPWKHETKL